MHDTGQHWLARWLDDAGTMVATPAAPRREVRQPPEVVVAALVQVVSSQAHLVGIEGFGTTVLFRPERGSATHRLLRADVIPHGSGHSVVEVSHEAVSETVAERCAERDLVVRILDTLSWRLRCPDASERPVVPEQPEVAPAAERAEGGSMLRGHPHPRLSRSSSRNT